MASEIFQFQLIKCSNRVFTLTKFCGCCSRFCGVVVVVIGFVVVVVVVIGFVVVVVVVIGFVAVVVVVVMVGSVVIA